MSKIKIAMIAGKWLGGGVESFLMNYLKYLDKNRFQIDIIIDDDSIDPPIDRITAMGGRVLFIPSYTKVFNYHIKLKQLLKKEKYDVVHSHINTLSFFPLFAAQLAGIKIRIAHSHSTSNSKEFWKNLVKILLKKSSKLCATHYFACSTDAAIYQFGRKAVDRENVYIIKNAIDLKRFKFNFKSRERLRTQLGIDDSTIVYGHIGRFVSQKNHDFLVRLFQKIKLNKENSRLILVGEGRLKNKIIDLVKQLELNDSVIFIDEVENVEDFYQAFDVFLFPSLYEGLGMVLIEAQASGLISIASEYVPIESKITSNIEFFTLNQELWLSHVLNIKNNYSRILNYELTNSGYDIKKEAMKLEEIYMELFKNDN